jgi:membrane-associated phospholipid phosphatase
VSHTAFFFTFAYLEKYRTPVWIVTGLIAVVVMSWARMKMHCHTLVQVVAGAGFGTVLAMGYWLVQKHVHAFVLAQPISPQ